MGPAPGGIGRGGSPAGGPAGSVGLGGIADGPAPKAGGGIGGAPGPSPPGFPMAMFTLVLPLPPLRPRPSRGTGPPSTRWTR